MAPTWAVPGFFMIKTDKMSLIFILIWFLVKSPKFSGIKSKSSIQLIAPILVSTTIFTSLLFSYEVHPKVLSGKRNVPRTDPCSTPVWTVSLSVSISFNLTYCFGFFKKLLLVKFSSETVIFQLVP